MRLAPPTKQKIDLFLRHPLTLSLTGMLLGSLLIPWIVGRSSKQAAVADTRLKQAMQVMTTSNGVDATINKIETAFEGFEKDALSIEQEDEFFRRREDLRKRVYDLYSEFDSTAWWWARNIYDQAHILHLISSARLDKLNEYIGQYNSNLVETAHAIDVPWHAYLGTNAVTHGPGAKEIMPSLDKRLRNLQQQRSEIAGNMAALFQ
ncbi:MAG TPA: hypothetical protein VF878_01690 [Candidatus Udaeobacter sp.]